MTDKKAMTHEELQAIFKEVLGCEPLGNFGLTECNMLLSHYIDEVKSLKNTDGGLVRLFALEKLKNRFINFHRDALQRQIDEMNRDLVIFSVPLESLSGTQRIEFLEHSAKFSDLPLAQSILDGLKFQIREHGKNGAKAKLSNDKDGKQESKKFVEECWLEWQKKPDSYSGQAEFARDMLSKCENLKSQPAIENWCREWKKKNTH